MAPISRYMFSPKEPIAIIGIGCRFPGGANSPAEFWQLLRNGVDAITEAPSDRWNIETLYHPDPVEPGRMYSRWGGFIEGIDQFDARFFGVSRQEAARMDPQHRLLLEVAWESLEDAGLPPENLAGGRVGVFIGLCAADYSALQLASTERDTLNAYSIMGVGNSVAATRISYLFDFHGPSMCIDTACSSSLTATYLACCSLWKGETDLALAGGVNVIIKPEVNIAESKAFLLAADGHCKSFDARADGYVRGEGVGIVVLKPLSQALADEDMIYAVIRAGVINQDGHKSSLPVPNGAAQEVAMRLAYQQVGIKPPHVHYVETQGTGTAVGDPIEANAIGAVLGTGRRPGNECRIGSVKTNIGHLEGASGVASLIKTALILKHGQIPPNLHFQTPNPKIPFDTLHLHVPQTLEPWPPQGRRRRLAGVNSFGVGGTNVHLVLEGAEHYLAASKRKQKLVSTTVIPVSPQIETCLFPLSARNLEALKAFVQAYLDFLAGPEGEVASLIDICYTASLRRSHHEHYRLAFITRSKAELAEQLAAYLQGIDPVDFEEQNKPLTTEEIEAQDSTSASRPAEDSRPGQTTDPEKEMEPTNLVTVFRQLYRQGRRVDWQCLYPRRGRFIRLPAYPWQHRSYWHESDQSKATRLGQIEQPPPDKKEKILYPFLQKLKNAPIYDRRQLLEEHLKILVAEVMDLDPSAVLDEQQGFFDLGMQSLQAINFGARLKMSLGVSIPATLAFKYPTIESLADHLQETLSLDSPAEKSSRLPTGTDVDQEGGGTRQFAVDQDLEVLLERTNDEETLLALLLQSLNEFLAASSVYDNKK